MATYGSADIKWVLVDGYDVTSLLPGGMDVGADEAVTENVRSYGEGWPRYADTGSRVAGNLKLMAIYDDVAGGTRDAFVGQEGVSRVVVWCVGGNVIGKRFAGFAGQLGQKITRVVADAKFTRANVEYVANGPSENGVILHPLGAETAAGDTTASSVDWSADVRARSAVIATSSIANPSIITTTGPHGLTSGQKVVVAGHSGSTPSINGQQTATVISPTTFSIPVNVTGGGTGGTVTHANTLLGGSAYIACSALTLGGYDNLVGKVQHSADNSTFADLITFTAITTAFAAERKVTTATVNRYLAAAWAYGGSGSAPSATIFIGFQRAADS